VPLVAPVPAGTPVAMVTIPGAERVGAITVTVALVLPAVLAVPADVLTVLTVVLAAPVAFPVTVADAPARVGLAIAVLGIGVERPGVSVAVVTVHAERIALNAAPAAPLRSMRRENRVGLISSTKSSSIC